MTLFAVPAEQLPPPPRRRSLRRTLALTFSAALLALAAPLVTIAVAQPAAALGNGLALTPQMGFNDWNAYGCNVSESLIKATAQAMHTDGMQAAGYSYVNIDDCWMTHSRDSGGRLVPDPAKFPDGIKGTADYVHSLGLKLGIYEDAGLQTCGGFPGSLGHETTDAQSFASWGVDYLKYDNCYAGPGCALNSCGNGNETPAQTRYTTMRDALASTGRPILFSLCNWGQENVWTWGANVGNSWRTTGDINASFSSMLSIFHSNVGLASYAGPGHWNDPDMLEVGNGSLSSTEARSEFSLWSEMAAPLIAGTNIASASSTTLSTLTNTRVIAVDQDSLGRQGTMVSSSGGLDVLAKPLANGDVSVALFNETGSAATISTNAGAVGKSGASSYTLTDLWSGAASTTSGAISASVPAHGTVMYRVAGGTTGGGAGTSGALRAVGAGKCLDVPNSSTTAGTQLQIWDCNSQPNQTWTRTSSNQLTVYSGSGQMCLDAYNSQTTAGTKVEVWGCNGQPNQQWVLNSNGTVTSAQSGLCLDVTGGSTANGALAELWTCNGRSNQQWTLD
ncbi:alpha-galactosidase [Streptomyces sp. DvalAA-14]|uniref:glycoside hydrolase family 27 protein n=1 Tax=unclassified Streptomyces TaxID=2593676 RepID=UPI00081B1189|nr:MULTISPECIES: glycoside hydrolase family 27 protein [unclassified Streptomyces]MYS21057.1 alpha-galactosidase [Streptomyces sp. SID4948]SCD83196.1 alpha-galactosidase [Streptomyces sp. DvalAA-14]